MSNPDSMKRSSDFAGRVALVTGASRGIGRAVALRLAERGAAVIVNFLSSESEAVETARQIDALGSDVQLVRGDVSQEEDVVAMVDEARSHFGAIDIVVSNAAAGGFRPLMETSTVNFEATIRTNTLPLLWLAKAASKDLSSRPQQGKIVAISSHGSRWAVPNYGSIGASKAALESLVRHLALELGAHRINVNCVLSGMVATKAVNTMPGTDDILKASGERAMMGSRALGVDDVAGVVAFLCGSDSDMIQGQTLVVDGGSSIRA
ncbi:MAG: SDR family oxidoreductase [Planctomycetota bacterium]